MKKPEFCLSLLLFLMSLPTATFAGLLEPSNTRKANSAEIRAIQTAIHNIKLRLPGHPAVQDLLNGLAKNQIVIHEDPNDSNNYCRWPTAWKWKIYLKGTNVVDCSSVPIRFRQNAKIQENCWWQEIALAGSLIHEWKHTEQGAARLLLDLNRCEYEGHNEAVQFTKSVKGELIQKLAQTRDLNEQESLIHRIRSLERLIMIDQRAADTYRRKSWF